MLHEFGAEVGFPAEALRAAPLEAVEAAYGQFFQPRDECLHWLKQWSFFHDHGRVWRDVKALADGAWSTAPEFIKLAPALNTVFVAFADGTNITSSLSELTGATQRQNRQAGESMHATEIKLKGLLAT